jgi:rhodanese-related sulfurtransferase
MTRLNTKVGAAVLAVLGLGYMIGSLVTHRSARAEPPPDLTAAAGETGVDVWKAAALLLDPAGPAALVDVRSAADYARWHAPGAVSAPGAEPRAVRDLLRQHPAVVVVAAKDDVAQKLVTEVRGEKRDARVYYLVDGPRAWYLALELPVPLFADTAAPRGYDDALAQLRGWLARPEAAGRGPARAALETLVKAGYQPSLLKTGGKAKAAGGARKKISGGCG